MPEVLGDPPSPRTALFWNGAAWQWALVDAQGHLQIDALSTVMDPLAATAAAQALALAQLQLIEDMRDALQSVATDRLIVRGEDQLQSYNRAFVNQRTVVVSGANGYCDSNTPADGEVWVVTNIVSIDSTTATSLHRYNRWNTVTDLAISEFRRAMAAGDRGLYNGWIWLEHDDVIRTYFTGSLVGDTTSVCLSGFVMTKET